MFVTKFLVVNDLRLANTTGQIFASFSCDKEYTKLMFVVWTVCSHAAQYSRPIFGKYKP